MQWQKGIPSVVSILMHSNISTRIKASKIFEWHKLPILPEKSVAKHSKIIGHLPHARLVRFRDKRNTLMNLCNE